MSGLTKWFSFVSMLFLLCPLASALNINQDPRAEDYFFARGIGAPVNEREKIFHPDAKRANFTAFEGVENVVVESGKLVFTLAGPKATVGWGNYQGKQQIADIEDMWQQANIVRLRVKQSAGRSKWTVCQWRDGLRIGQPGKESERQIAKAELDSGDWREVVFKPLNAEGAIPDGLEFKIEGDKGARIEIEWIKLVQPVYEGYCRKEFTLPDVKVWRAIADVGSANDRNWMGGDQISSRLYINGKLVPRRGSLFLYHAESVDITPYLKPGRNCVGLYCFRINGPSLLYFQAKVVMESGEIVPIASGKDWKYSPHQVEGWTQPGFNDSTWANVQSGPGVDVQARDPLGRLNMPAYGGRLMIKNPHRRDLFYKDNDEVAVDVLVPAGLKGRQPVLSYALGKSDVKGVCAPVKEGHIPAFSEQGNSLTYRLNLGRHEHGVYALALSLKADDGAVIEERPREPLVVLRKVPQKVIEGKNYTEGLDLELEDTVNFADPNDPHPWIEVMAPRKQGDAVERISKPNIVTKDGLVYREVTGGRRSSGFSYRIEFKHPGDFYFFELEYPDDGRRITEVSITHKNLHAWINTESGAGAETGGRFLPTGIMQQLHWVQIARPGPHSVDIINCSNGLKAGAKSFKMYHIKGDLPSIGAGTQRSYGVLTERCSHQSAIGSSFGLSMDLLPGKFTQDRNSNEIPPPMQLYLGNLVWMEVTGERYVQYLRFCGQNCHIMGCIQGSEYNTPFVPVSIPDDSRILNCMRTMIGNIFDANDIDFYAGVEFSALNDTRTYANNAQLAKGADSIWMVNSKGKQRYGYVLGMIANWLHPRIWKDFDQIMSDLNSTFGHLGRFRGAATPLLPASHPAGYYIPGFANGISYDPMDASFDDVATRLFEKDTGIKIPVLENDPLRFTKRADFLNSPEIRRRFLAWRCEKLEEFHRSVLKTLRRGRPDLKIQNALGIQDPNVFQSLEKTGRSFDEFLKDVAIDMNRLNSVEGVCNGRWTISWCQPGFPGPSAQQDPYLWLARTSPRVISAFEGGNSRPVYVRTSWDENRFVVVADSKNDRIIESDWIIGFERIEPMPQPSGYNCRDAFIQAIITADPDFLVGAFIDLGINSGNEQLLRSILGTYTHLPREKFKPVLNTGLESNLAIRQLTKGNDSYFYIANPCQWHVNGVITLETDGNVTELVSGRLVPLKQSGKVKELSVKLTPFDLAAYRVNSPDLKITAYRTGQVNPKELARLQDVVNRITSFVNDNKASANLDSKDRQFIVKSLKDTTQSIKAGEYARAWSILTHYRVWANCQDVFEKTANP